MSGILQVILTTVLGTVVEAVCFSVWFTCLMTIYIFLYGSFSMNLLIFSSVSFDKPIFTAFITGLVVGSILGFFTGLSAGLLGADTPIKCTLIGVIVAVIFLSGLFFLSSGASFQNPIELIFVIFTDIPIKLITSFWLLIPAAATGVALARVIFFINSKQNFPFFFAR